MGLEELLPALSPSAAREPACHDAELLLPFVQSCLGEHHAANVYACMYVCWQIRPRLARGRWLPGCIFPFICGRFSLQNIKHGVE